jgi:hypothetical protein
MIEFILFYVHGPKKMPTSQGDSTVALEHLVDTNYD